MLVFIKTDMLGNKYDGWVYIIENFTKSTPDNMLFSNTWNVLKYKDNSVESILRKKNDIGKNWQRFIKSKWIIC